MAEDTAESEQNAHFEIHLIRIDGSLFVDKTNGQINSFIIPCLFSS